MGSTQKIGQDFLYKQIYVICRNCLGAYWIHRHDVGEAEAWGEGENQVVKQQPRAQYRFQVQIAIKGMYFVKYMVVGVGRLLKEIMI